MPHARFILHRIDEINPWDDEATNSDGEEEDAQVITERQVLWDVPDNIEASPNDAGCVCVLCVVCCVRLCFCPAFSMSP